MDQNKIGKFIAENRKKKNLTQDELAEKLGITSKTISRWENGNYMPDVSLYKPICETLDITLNELFEGEYLSNDKIQEVAEKNVLTLLNKDKKNKKLKRSLIIISSILVFIVISIIGMYFYFSHQFTFTETLKLNWNVTIPSNLKEIYHADTGASFHGDGERYNVYSGEKLYSFYNNFSKEKNSDLEKDLKDLYSKLNIKKKNQVDFTHEYAWQRINHEDKMSYVYIIYDLDVDKIYFYENIV